MIDTTQFKNNKYLVGDFHKSNQHQNWYVGSFLGDDHPCNTDHVEFAYKEHSVGDRAEAHYHQEKVEVSIILEGKVKYIINDKEMILVGGQYIFIDVNNVVVIEFLEQTKMFVIHSPSLPQDKVTV